MKLRTDFVTNSSSTSYIIELSVEHPLVGLKEKYKDDPIVMSLLETVVEIVSRFNKDQLFNHSDESGVGPIISTREGLDRYFRETYSYWGNQRKSLEQILEDECFLEEYNKMLKSIEAGKKVATVCISYHNDIANKIFEALRENGFIRVLNGGYS